MHCQTDEEARKVGRYEFRAALIFLLVIFVLIVGGLGLSTYLCFVIMRSLLFSLTHINPRL